MTIFAEIIQETMKKILLLILTFLALVSLAGCSKENEDLVPDNEAGVPEVLNFITCDSPVGTIGMIDDTEGIVVELPAIGKKTYCSAQPAKKVVIATKNIGANKPEDYGDYDTGEVYDFGKGWHLPYAREIYALIEMTNKKWTGNGYKWTFDNTGTYLFLPAAGSLWDPYSIGYYGHYWTCELPEEFLGADQCFLEFNSKHIGVATYSTGYVKASLRPFHDFPQK